MALDNNEILWLQRGNSIDLKLYADSSAVDLGSVTQIKLNLGSLVVDSTDSASGPIRWNQAGYETGEIRILASTTISYSTGKFKGALVVFDAANPAGIVWDDNIRIRIKSDPLAT